MVHDQEFFRGRSPLYLQGVTYDLSAEQALELAKQRRPCVLREQENGTFSVYSLGHSPTHTSQMQWMGPFDRRNQLRDHFYGEA